MRYRIENAEGRIWDSKDHRWRSLHDGRYNTYRSEAAALAAARKIRAPGFLAYEDKRIVKDR